MKRAAILKQIELLRAKNNKLWMGYVRLAIQHAPKQALKLHKRVMALDAKITELGRRLHD